MDGPGDYHSKWSKSDRQISCDITCMWNLTKATNEHLYLHIYKTETDIENEFMGTKGERGGEG